MKKLLLLFGFCLLSVTVICQDFVNVMTFNIRYSTAADSMNAWTYRKDKAASQVLFHDVDIMGVQEALASQMKDLQQRLPGYSSVGVAREDGKEKGEFSAIFYNNKRFELLKGETFWLSQTPDVVGSKGWDAALARVATWGRFRDRKTKKEFYFFNTHFDHVGKEARRESAKLLIRRVNEIAGKLPVIITGDFNAKPADEPIKVIMNADDPLHFVNAKDVSETPHYGPTGTFTGFTSKELGNDPIDYIFIRNKVKVLKHATLSQTWEGRFSSDHFPVFARVVL